MGISLYRRYRPQKFSEVTGQPAAVDVLTKSLERGLVGHAYLFSGPRGCGKTTAARLLAKALNCLSPDNGEPCCECKNCLAIAAGESLDVVEIDGASNNGVDEVRELKTHVTLAPFSSRCKVYIIDEVHMLSTPAFNALLKTLEEPPSYVVFILATTEAHKVPVTIRSRCQHIPFHRIGARDIYDRLALVCSAEGITSAPDALWEIARQADGALRDALSMLEQISGLGKSEITLPDVEAALGQISRSSMERWISGWRGADIGPDTFTELDRLLSSGASPQRFIEELFSLLRNLWLAARWKDALASLDASEQEKEYLGKEARLWEPKTLESLMRFLAELMPQVRMGLRIDVLSGLLMAKIAGFKDGGPAEERTQSTASLPNIQNLQSTASAPNTPNIPNIPKKAAPSPAPAQQPAEPAARLDASAWKPYPEEKWDGALAAAREKEFTLYCALLDAAPLADEQRDNALILDIKERYCYEVLRLDRHRQALKDLLTPFHGTGEVLLRCGDRWVSCDAALQTSAPAGKKRSSGKKAAVSVSGTSGAPDVPETDEQFIPSSMPPEREPESQRPESQRPEGQQRSPSNVPFSGLVQEVARWLSGELIMVRAGDEREITENAESGDYDEPIEETSADE